MVLCGNLIGFAPSQATSTPAEGPEEAARACCGTTWAPLPGRTWPPSLGEPSPAGPKGAHVDLEILLENHGRFRKDTIYEHPEKKRISEQIEAFFWRMKMI